METGRQSPVVREERLGEGRLGLGNAPSPTVRLIEVPRGWDPKRDLHEKCVGMVAEGITRPLFFEPGGRVTIELSQPRHLLVRIERAAGAALEKGSQGIFEVFSRLPQRLLDLRRQPARRRQEGDIRCLTGMGRIVDEQHDASPRIVLQGSRQQRPTHHKGIFLVGRHEDGHGGRTRPVKEAIELVVGRPTVLTEPVEMAQSGQLVDKTSVDQEADDRQEQPLPQAGDPAAARDILDQRQDNTAERENRGDRGHADRDMGERELHAKLARGAPTRHREPPSAEEPSFPWSSSQPRSFGNPAIRRVA